MKVLRNNGEIVEVNFEEQEGKEAFWHTSAHVLAQAVKRLYPETKCAIGPAIENLGRNWEFLRFSMRARDYLCFCQKEWC